MSKNPMVSILSLKPDDMDNLTPAEKGFAKYVLRNEDIVYKSITEVTEESYIGYGTIIRFCQKLGFSGFQDFKIHLAWERGRRYDGWYYGATDFRHSAAENAASQLLAVASAIPEVALVDAADRIWNARRILVIGVAGSAPSASEFAYRLARLGMDSFAEPDSHMQAIRCSSMDSEDALVAVSFSGGTKEILDAVDHARKAGTPVIALTNHRSSPLGECADVVLSTAIWEEALQAELGSKLPFIFVIELLVRIIYSRYASAAEAIKSTADSVSAKQI